MRSKIVLRELAHHRWQAKILRAATSLGGNSKALCHRRCWVDGGVAILRGCDRASSGCDQRYCVAADRADARCVAGEAHWQPRRGRCTQGKGQIA
jgi:hypothetical protein